LRIKVHSEIKIPFVASIKKNKRRPAPGATATSGHSAEKKRQHKSATRQSDPRAYSSVLPGPWQVNTAIALLCVLATAALYAGDLHLGFFRIDDPQYVAGNPWI
jgi:hypothetical protein